MAERRALHSLWSQRGIEDHAQHSRIRVLTPEARAGTYHQLSIKHLHRYLNEFGYRFNRREDADIFEQTARAGGGIAPMPYSKLVEETAFTPVVRHQDWR